jgi:serine/threonine-protein kinase
LTDQRAPAGWYPDPHGRPDLEQYWDGEQWTPQRRPISASHLFDASNPWEIGGFRIEAEIGRGGMGIVYVAEQLSLGRKVALKLIAPALAQDPEFRARFEHEAHTAASIDHPNVVPVYEAGTEDGVLYIAMRYVPGTDLKSLLVTEGPLQAENAARMAAQVGAALDAAHGMGLIHRDVKPGNILYAGQDAASHVYLTDFGLTKASSSVSGLTHTGEWVGTVDYVAPEQLDHRPIDARTDVYALGCVLFHALTGRSPFGGGDVQKMWAHMHTEPPRLTQHSHELAQQFDPVIAQAMAKDPDDRFQSAGALGRAAEAAARGEELPLVDGRTATGAPVSAATAQPLHTPIDAGAPSGASTRPRPAPAPHQRLPDPPTQVLDKPRRSYAGVIAAVCGALVLVAGVAVGAVLATRSGSDGSSKAGDQAQRAHSRPKAKEHQSPHLRTVPSNPSQGPSTYAHYGASASGGYSARLPADPGWAVQPEQNQNSPGESPLWRTIVKGPSGTQIWIDYTSDQPAGDPGGTVTDTVAVPGFGEVADGHRLSSCADFGSPGPCVDYITQIQGGAQGIAVLGFGENLELATMVAKRIASSLSPGG